MPKHAVISQEPEAASFVKANRKIYLYINASNFRKVRIKPFFSKTVQVIAQLRSSGFKIGELEYVDDPGKDVVRKLKFEGKIEEGTFSKMTKSLDRCRNGKVTYLSKKDSVVQANKAFLDSIAKLKSFENAAENF